MQDCCEYLPMGFTKNGCNFSESILNKNAYEHTQNLNG